MITIIGHFLGVTLLGAVTQLGGLLWVAAFWAIRRRPLLVLALLVAVVYWASSAGAMTTPENDCGHPYQARI